SGYSIIYVVIGVLITQILIFILMGLLLIKEIGIKVPKFRNMKDYLSFGVPTIPTTLSFWIVDSSDRYVISILLGTAFVGYYSPGYTLGNLIQRIVVPFAVILPSLLSPYHDKNEINEIKIFLKYSLKYFLALGIPAVFGLSVLSKQILLILTTPEIAIQGYLITPFVALGALFFGIYGIFSQIFILEKETKIVGLIWIIASISNLILNILLVPYFGFLGAAIVTLFAYLFVMISVIISSFKYLRFDRNIQFIVKSTFASAVMAGFIIGLNPMGIISIILTILISIIIYIVILLILRGITKQEIELFMSYFKSNP
ncbi:MAG: polysaccharide biosynthesis C-terminal domain-containing protein, partial [Methanobacterium sp.]|nr:polysaccharide biosynthesis C-terminal domain-containing protein [Methanobacterium sp.]